MYLCLRKVILLHERLDLAPTDSCGTFLVGVCLLVARHKNPSPLTSLVPNSSQVVAELLTAGGQGTVTDVNDARASLLPALCV